VTGLIDDTSRTAVSFTAAGSFVQYRFTASSPQVTFYTLTSGTTAADPTGWTLSGSSDATTWTVLDQRSGQTFPWRLQTRAFKVASPGAYAYYRLEMTGAAGTTLAEVELLARP
jgi:hypothetical protein